MKLTITGALAVVATVAMLSACGSDDDKSTAPTTTTGTDVSFPTGDSLPAGDTLPGPDVTFPSGLTIPPGGTFPSDLTIPQEVIDQMLTQFEAAGLNVDRDCFEELLADEELRRLIAAGDTPSAEVIQRLTSCFQQ